MPVMRPQYPATLILLATSLLGCKGGESADKKEPPPSVELEAKDTQAKADVEESEEEKKKKAEAQGWVDYLKDLESEYAEAIDILTARGASLAWMISPHLNRERVEGDFNNPARTDRLNELVLPLVVATPRHAFVDYPGFLGPLGGDQETTIRDDGVHTAEARQLLSSSRLGPALSEPAAVHRARRAAAVRRSPWERRQHPARAGRTSPALPKPASRRAPVATRYQPHVASWRAA